MRAVRVVVPVFISLVVVVAVVGALWALGSGGGRDRFSTLELVPKDVTFYLAINTEPSSSQWIAFDRVLETLNTKGPLLDAIDEALAEVDLEWERDILPLAGDEAYFALTDIDALEEDRGWVMAFQLRDPGRAEEIFLDLAERSEEEEGEVLREEGYQGETIYYFESAFPNLGSEFDGAAGTDVGIAFLDDVSVLGFSRDDVKEVIDVMQGRSASAEENQRLQELRRRQDDEFLFWGYFDVADVWDLVEESIQEEARERELDTEQLFREARAQTDRMSFAISARGDGFILDTFAFRSPDAEDTTVEQTVFDSRYAEMVPESTLLFAAGFDLFNESYVPVRDAVAESSIDSEDQQTIEEALEEFEREIGFDLEDDLLGLMTGEFAVAFNASDLDADQPDFDVLALFDADDAERIRDTLLRLSDYFERQELLVTEGPDGEDVYRWRPPDGSGDALAWTVSGDSLAVGFPETSVTDFIGEASPSLADTSDWKHAMDLLPDDKTFVAYLSLARLIEEVRETEDAEEEFERATEGKVTFDDLLHIRSLGMATTTVEDGVGLSVVIFVQE